MYSTRFQLHSYYFNGKKGLRHFSISHIFSLIIGLHLGRHLGYIEMLNDARVASLGFFKDNIMHYQNQQRKKFKIKFQVLLKFAQTLQDYFFRAQIVNPHPHSNIWTSSCIRLICLFDLIIYVPSTIFQLNRDGSSWVGPVLSWDKC